MNVLSRPILRSLAIRKAPQLSPSLRRPVPLVRPPILGANPALLQVRWEASRVSMRPGSQSLEHAATNVREELGNSATDLAKVIAGANVAGDSVVDSSAESFVRF